MTDTQIEVKYLMKHFGAWEKARDELESIQSQQRRSLIRLVGKQVIYKFENSKQETGIIEKVIGGCVLQVLHLESGAPQYIRVDHILSFILEDGREALV